MSVCQASASTAYDVAPERPARESTRPCAGQFKDIRRSHWTAPTDPNRDTRMSKADFGDKGCLRKINRRFLGNPQNVIGQEPTQCSWPMPDSRIPCQRSGNTHGGYPEAPEVRSPGRGGVKVPACPLPACVPNCRLEHFSRESLGKPRQRVSQGGISKLFRKICRYL